MRSKIVAVLGLSAALVVPAALAQESGTQSGSAQPAAMSTHAAKIEVTGTIVTLTTDRIDVRVDSVKAPQGTSAPSSIVEGQKTAFTLDSSSQMPQGLKVGDKVDLWFANHNGSLLATRVALAVGEDQSAGTYGSTATSQSASTSGNAEQPASEAASSSSSASESASSSSEQASANSSSNTPAEQSSTSAAQPANEAAMGKTAAREKLPKTGSPLPLIGLIGLVALASALVLRFAVRA